MIKKYLPESWKRVDVKEDTLLYSWTRLQINELETEETNTRRKQNAEEYVNDYQIL